MSVSQGGTVAQYIGAPWAVAIGATVVVAMAGVMFIFSPSIRALRSGIPGRPGATYAVSADGDED